MWAAHGEATAILAGDALLGEAMRLALTYPTPDVARELVLATQRMIGGQQLDLRGRRRAGTAPRAEDRRALRRLDHVRPLGGRCSGGPSTRPWRAFAAEVGLLFQVVDDVLDGDGYARAIGEEGARKLAGDVADRARARLDEVDGDTGVLRSIVDDLAVRTA